MFWNKMPSYNEAQTASVWRGAFLLSLSRFVNLPFSQPLKMT